ncbi:MAG: carboxypeptidase-like regulatory domain-containing protein [Crocinitomicaceae bacterium]
MTTSLKILILFLTCSVSQLNALPSTSRYLILKGTVVDESNLPIPFTEIEIRYKAEFPRTSMPISEKTKADSAGQYNIEIKKFGNYKLTFSSANKIAYSVTCNYTKNNSLFLRKIEFVQQLNVKLLPQTSKQKSDAYNGVNLKFDENLIVAVPYKRYLESTDYKFKKGFKTEKKLWKYVRKQIKKKKLKKLLRSLANQAEIDFIIKDVTHSEESRNTWRKNFGTKSYQLDMEQSKIEFAQKVFYQINHDKEDKSLLFKGTMIEFERAKTVKLDPGRKLFSVYKFEFENEKGQKLAYDIVSIKTFSGWKIAKIFPHQVV